MKGSLQMAHSHNSTLAITSGKGGVGKTSLAVNLAYALSTKGYRVLLVDGDLGLANVDILLGLGVKKTIRDVLEYWSDPFKSIIYLDDNLGVLPASSGVPEMVTLGTEEQSRLGSFLDEISTRFDFTLIDTAAGIGPTVLWFNQYASYNLVLMDPDPTSLTDSYALMKVLSRKYEKKDMYLILNLIGSSSEGEEIYERMQRITRMFLNLRLHYLGSIPPDAAVRDAVREQHPFMLKNANGPAALAVQTLAENIGKLLRKSYTA